MPFQKKSAVAQSGGAPALNADPEDNKVGAAGATKTVDTANLTPEELAIARRVAGEDDGWKHPVGEDSALDFSMGGDPFRLPPPAKKAQDDRKYRFRWIARTKERVDHIRTMPIPRRWWICNRTTTPFLKKFIDPVLGCVCKEDQMLVFKPYDHYEREREMVMRVTENKDHGGNLAAKHGLLDSRGSTAMSAASGRPVGQGNPAREEIKGGDVMMDADLRDVLDAVDGGNNYEISDE